MRPHLWVFILILACVRAGIAQEPRQCAGIAPDSVWLQSGLVYQDCEMEFRARRRGDEPRLDLDPVRQVVEYLRSVATPQVAKFPIKIINHPTDRFRADPPRPALKGC